MVQLGYALSSEEHTPNDLSGYDHVYVHQVVRTKKAFPNLCTGSPAKVLVGIICNRSLYGGEAL